MAASVEDCRRHALRCVLGEQFHCPSGESEIRDLAFAWLMLAVQMRKSICKTQWPVNADDLRHREKLGATPRPANSRRIDHLTPTCVVVQSTEQRLVRCSSMRAPCYSSASADGAMTETAEAALARDKPPRSTGRGATQSPRARPSSIGLPHSRRLKRQELGFSC
jgi:hypothetical protein